MALNFDYPEMDAETNIIMHETGIPRATANKLVKFAIMTRNLKDSGLDEGANAWAYFDDTARS